MITVENQHTFNHCLESGINLFVGAGFSLLAKDRENRSLPLGAELRNELSSLFNKPKSFSLPQLSTILESTCSREFHSYLERRFDVVEYDPLYENIHKINIRSIYTTNIDNLIPRIFENNKERYLHYQYANGPTEDGRGVNYLPLHGCINVEPRKYVFDVASITNIYSEAPRIWNLLARELEIRPTLFIGYGFNDSAVIQTLTSQATFNNSRKDIWVVLRSEDIEYSEYYKSLGFHIIEASTKDFLEYIGSFNCKKKNQSVDDGVLALLESYSVPKTFSSTFQRPIKDFFMGSSPEWCDIMSNLIRMPHYAHAIMDGIYEQGKNIIIVGAPVSGKTTLLMNAAIAVKGYSIRLFFASITKERALFIVKLIGNKDAIIFIDNLYDSIDGAEVFTLYRNIKLVCAERSHYFSIVSHLFDPSRFKVINVTSLDESDLQGIYSSLPESLRAPILHKESLSNPYDGDSIFEFIIKNVSVQNIRDRYADAISSLELKDRDLAEFLVLCAYMHNSHIPLSFEMAYDYFDTFDVNSVFSLRNDASDIIKDYIPLIGKERYEDMDYYYPRSRHVAEIIINSCSASLLKEVLENTIGRIPTIHICNYEVFRRFAFDKNIVMRAYKNWKEGQSYYERAYLYDRMNPYVLQQGALYLAQKKQYDLAFQWIDRAISLTDDHFFSIRNSHAIILFNANIEKEQGNYRNELDRSMRILEKCMKDDARKRFHAVTYGKQAIRYYSRFADDIAIAYLEQSYVWLSEECHRSPWDREVMQTYDSIKKVLNR